jgi:prolyl-tRNA synthetase
VKFKDADLIGIPLRIGVGSKGLKDGNFELKWRTEEQPRPMPVAGAADAIARLVAEAKAQLDAA